MSKTPRRWPVGHKHKDYLQESLQEAEGDYQAYTSNPVLAPIARKRVETLKKTIYMYGYYDSVGRVDEYRGWLLGKINEAWFRARRASTPEREAFYQEEFLTFVGVLTNHDINSRVVVVVPESFSQSIMNRAKATVATNSDGRRELRVTFGDNSSITRVTNIGYKAVLVAWDSVKSKAVIRGYSKTVEGAKKHQHPVNPRYTDTKTLMFEEQ